jgi:hypothetical protein
MLYVAVALTTAATAQGGYWVEKATTVRQPKFDRHDLRVAQHDLGTPARGIRDTFSDHAGASWPISFVATPMRKRREIACCRTRELARDARRQKPPRLIAIPLKIWPTNLTQTVDGRTLSGRSRQRNDV